MEPQQGLVKPDRLRQRRHRRIGRNASIGRVPIQEPGHRPEGRPVGSDLEGVLGERARLFARRVERERLVRNEVVERRTVGVRQRSPSQQVIVGGDRDRLKLRLGAQRDGESAVDLGKQPRQIPRLEIRAWGLSRCGALHELPAIPLKILPVPMRQDRLQDRLDLDRRAPDLGFQPPDSLRSPVALDRGFEGGLPGNRFDRLRPGAVREGTLDDGGQFLDRRLGQAFLDRLLDAFPLGVPRRRLGARTHEQKTEQDSNIGFHGAGFSRQCIRQPRTATVRLDGDLETMLLRASGAALRRGQSSRAASASISKSRSSRQMSFLAMITGSLGSWRSRQ